MDIFEKLLKKAGPLGQHADDAYGYYMFPRLEGEIGPRMTFRGKEMLNWSLNNYLGLANHPEVRKADADAAADYGLAYPMGARMMSGNSTFHEWDRNNSGFLNADYDYEVQLGSSIYEISNMQVEKKTKKCGGLLSLECPDCHNPVTKFLLSGTEKTITANEVYFLD